MENTENRPVGGHKKVDRRRFLKLTGMVAAGAIVAGCTGRPESSDCKGVDADVEVCGVEGERPVFELEIMSKLTKPESGLSERSREELKTILETEKMLIEQGKLQYRLIESDDSDYFGLTDINVNLKTGELEGIIVAFDTSLKAQSGTKLEITAHELVHVKRGYDDPTYNLKYSLWTRTNEETLATWTGELVRTTATDRGLIEAGLPGELVGADMGEVVKSLDKEGLDPKTSELFKRILVKQKALWTKAEVERLKADVDNNKWWLDKIESDNEEHDIEGAKQRLVDSEKQLELAEKRVAPAEEVFQEVYKGNWRPNEQEKKWIEAHRNDTEMFEPGFWDEERSEKRNWSNLRAVGMFARAVIRAI